MKRALIFGAGALALVVLGGSPAEAASGKPDGRIKVAGGDFSGNKVFSPPTPVTEQQLVAEGDTRFKVKVKNRGTKKDKIFVQASGPLLFGAGRQILYKGEDRTHDALLGELEVKVKVGKSSKGIVLVQDLTDANPASAATTLLVLKSRNSPTRGDAVLAIATNAPA